MASGVSMGSLLQSLEDFKQGPSGGRSANLMASDVLDRVEEFVEVPNTEFVALIVGRNGHKIKAIRERTDTFIKTPMRNEPPVFKIAGHVQNVNKAKQEILEIVQRLKSPQYRMGALLGDDPQEQRITSNVRVPFKFVGLVVGFQGSTIMEIQFKTKTHIQTPAHGGEPIFQITGEPKNVWIAKLMIQIYIEYRTGLRVVEIEALLEEALDPAVLKLLFKFGVQDTLAAVNSQLDSLMANETNRMTNPMDLDPIEAIAMSLTAFNLEQNSGYDSVDMHAKEEYCQSSSPDSSSFFDFRPMNGMSSQVDRTGYEGFQGSSQCQKMHQDLISFHDDAFDAQTQLELNLNAITYQAINTLFPDPATPEPEMHVPSTYNSLVEPLTPPSPQLQAHQQQPQYPVQQANQGAAASAAYEKQFAMDKSPWEYLADLLDLPPEQVL